MNTEEVKLEPVWTADMGYRDGSTRIADVTDTNEVKIYRNDETFVKETFTDYIFEGVETLILHILNNPSEHGFGKILSIQWSWKDGYLITDEHGVRELQYESVDVYTLIRR
jgi:hypothetical protein